jgi:F-type H+-transporting ATPase subunit a
MNVTLAAEDIFSIGGFQVTNALFSAVLITIFLLISIVLITRGLKYANPSKGQLVLEMIVSLLYNLVKDILGDVQSKKLFGFLFTFVVFIFTCNWFGLIPFVPSTVIKGKEVQTVDVQASTEVSVENFVAPKEPTFEECLKNKKCYLTAKGIEVIEGHSKHIFRAPTSDLSFTLALAIISLVVTNTLGFMALKKDYIKKFIDLSNPLNTFIGAVELLSEFSKLLSFSFRLFGNIFAGEMLLVVITGITYGILTLPFLGLELFVGVIQAFVFFMLTTVFISVATTKQH